MERQLQDENSPRARHAFCLQWVQQRLGEWEHSFKKEELYKSWLLRLIKENGYTLKELNLLRENMVFVRTIGTIASLVIGAKRRLRGILRHVGIGDMDQSPTIDELVQSEVHRHECLIVDILSEAIEHSRRSPPKKRR